MYFRHQTCEGELTKSYYYIQQHGRFTFWKWINWNIEKSSKGRWKALEFCIWKKVSEMAPIFRGLQYLFSHHLVIEILFITAEMLYLYHACSCAVYVADFKWQRWASQNILYYVVILSPCYMLRQRIHTQIWLRASVVNQITGSKLHVGNGMALTVQRGRQNTTLLNTGIIEWITVLKTLISFKKYRLSFFSDKLLKVFNMSNVFVWNTYSLHEYVYIYKYIYIKQMYPKLIVWGTSTHFYWNYVHD